MAPEGEYAPSPFPLVRDQVARYEATDGRDGGTLEGRAVIILTHRGARSGKLRKTPVIKIRHRGGYLVVASFGGVPTHPSWFYNLRADPLVEVRDRAVVKTMVAREVPAADRAALWPIAEAAWPHFPEYRSWSDREFPMFELREAGGAALLRPDEVAEEEGDREDHQEDLGKHEDDDADPEADPDFLFEGHVRRPYRYSGTSGAHVAWPSGRRSERIWKKPAEIWI
ncbi:MAG: nitroreductase family deazaflavin-dependent oxidoreductase [Solirubrobacterales bacterium]